MPNSLTYIGLFYIYNLLEFRQFSFQPGAVDHLFHVIFCFLVWINLDFCLGNTLYKTRILPFKRNSYIFSIYDLKY